MEKNKRTLKEELKMILRAVRIWQGILPAYFPYMIFSSLTGCFLTFFPLYMSAEIVNELSSSCETSRLLSLTLVTILGTFGLSVLSRFLDGRLQTITESSYIQQDAYIFDAENNFQYEHLENPEVSLMYHSMQSISNATAGGLSKILLAAPLLFKSLLNVITSIALTCSLFRTAAGNYTGFFALVNSPLAVVLLIAIIAGNTVLSTKLSNYTTDKINAAIDDLSACNNMMFTYLTAQGTDMHIFKLNRITLFNFESSLLRPKWIEKYGSAETQQAFGSQILNLLVKMAVFLFSAAKAWMGVIGIGNFILYQGTVQKFVTSISELAGTLGILIHNNEYLENTFAYLDLPNEMYKGTLAVEKRDDIDYEVEFRDVSFKYPRSEEWILRHVNLKFKIGDKLAIVGENGSGKTTFIKLLCRLYDPTEGRILLNGIDITRYRYDEYMDLFSVVFQDYSLFAFSIAENVAANAPAAEIDEKRVLSCLTRVGMGEKIAGLEKGIHTNISRDYENDGVDFSGGELQKIALARALYKNAPFIILDEPTAALDPIAEAEVYARFNDIANDKTSVYISHRLSSCRFCDRIAVFQHGEIVQLGSHEELLSDTCGKYHELWNAQAQYYIAEANPN